MYKLHDKSVIDILSLQVFINLTRGKLNAI
jgi:hypothetical protein